MGDWDERDTEGQVMSESRRRRLRPSRASDRPKPETAGSVLPGVPRVDALDALLREVDSLRLTLETDLTLAAAAVEGGAPHLAADILDSDRDGLRAFEQRALGHLEELAAPRRRRLRVPAAPFVAAAAVAGFLLGVVPHTTRPTVPDTITAQAASADRSLADLEAAASSGQTAQAIAAANQLHGQIAQVLAAAQDDPKAAKAALALLHKEQVVLQSAGDAAALDQVLAVSRQLSRTLLTVLKTAPPSSVPTAPVVVAASSHPRPHSSPTPTSRPATAPTSSPSPSAKPRPATSPSASPSPSSGTGLPGTPRFS